jgi:IS5 family transposase
MYVAVGITNSRVAACGPYYARGKAETAADDLTRLGYIGRVVLARANATDWPTAEELEEEQG